MAEDDNEFEDEFEFESEDIFDEGAKSSSDQPAPTTERKKRSFPWIVVIIVAGVGGYFGWQFYQKGLERTGPGDIVADSTPNLQPTGPDEPAFMQQPNQLDQQLQAIAEQQPTVPAIEPEPTPNIPSIDVEDVEEAVSRSKADIEKTIGILKKDVTELSQTNSEKIVELEKDIELIANKIVNVDNTFNAVKQDIMQVTKILKDLTLQVSELQSSREAQKAQLAAKARQQGRAQASKSTQMTFAEQPRVSQTMTIHAIIPGRAWIRTQDGKTLSITEGDMLSQYGKVLKIDAPTGIVVTSSGVTIR